LGATTNYNDFSPQKIVQKQQVTIISPSWLWPWFVS